MMKKSKTTAEVRRAKKGIGFIAPAFSKTARLFMIAFGGAYLRFIEGVTKVSIIHEERIIDAMKKFHSGGHRLIFVFRHAAEEDPPVLMNIFNKLGHVRFLYGRDVPNWAGPAAAWLFPKIGAIPVQNRGGNREALSILRREMKEGRFPIALAPEEQVVYHMYHTSEIAPGISSLVRWGHESGKPVAVIPLALGYTYGRDPAAFIRKMLSRWEEQTGFSLDKRESGELYPLLTQAADKTFSILEDFYGLQTVPDGNNYDGRHTDPDKIDKRQKSLCEAILTAAEKANDLPADGDRMDRLFRIRYAGVDAFYPENLDPAIQPVLPRALLDFKALKAEVSIRHSQIVDVLEYIHMSYILPPFSAGRGCEFILNLLDLINRVNGGDIGSRYSPKGQQAAVFAGEPLIYNTSSINGNGRREYLDGIKADVKVALQKVSEEIEPLWETVNLR